MIKARRLGDVDCVAELSTRGLFQIPLLDLVVEWLSSRLNRLAEDERGENIKVRA